MDPQGYINGDKQLLAKYCSAQERCWHADPEWLKHKHWDWKAPWCWNLRNLLGVEGRLLI